MKILLHTQVRIISSSAQVSFYNTGSWRMGLILLRPLTRER